MRPNVIDIDVADASTTGFATGLTGAGPFTTFDATTPTDGLAHQVSLTSTANLGSINMTIVGTDANGVALTETRAGPNNNTVETTAYFKTISSITAASTLGGNTMDVGWVDEVVSHTYPIDYRSNNQCNIHVDVTGTIDFTVDQTFANILAGETAVWTDITALADKTADTSSVAAAGATAIRLTVNSYSSGAELQVYTSQTAGS